MNIIAPFVFLTICGIASFILNIFLLIVFIRGFPILCKLPYYFYCFQILFCNITSLIVKFVYMPIFMLLPTGTTIIPERYMVIIALAESISYHGELFFILALSVYRLIIFVFGKQLENRYIFLHILLVWSVNLGFVFFQCYFQCFDTTISPKVNENGTWNEIEFYSSCTSATVSEYLLILATTISNDHFPVISLVLYGCIAFKVRYDVLHFVKTLKLKSMVEKKTHRSDLYILLQALAIYACFFINFRILCIIGYDYKKKDFSLIYMIIYFSMYIRNTIQPIFLLFFNTKIRKIAQDILLNQRIQKNVVIVISIK